MEDKKLGRQEPTFAANIKPYAYSDGESAVKLAAAYFGSPLPWQQHIIELLLARTQEDKYTHRSFAISLPRQNGKSWLVLARCIYGLVTEGENILYTCQHGDTANEMFSRIASVFDSDESDELSNALGAVIRRTNGQEFIALSATGGKIQFKTRTNSLVRGRSYDVVIYDEAQDLTDAQFAASRFTTSASKTHNVQIIYLGTPTPPESPGTVFKDIHNRVHAGDSKTSWVEWAAKYVGDPFDEKRWFETNPSLGMLIERNTVADEASDCTPEVFARERLGWWSPVGTQVTAIPRELWESTYIPGIGDEYNKKTAIGIKFSVDATRYAVAGCRLDKDGNAAFELIEVGSMGQGLTTLATQLLKQTNKVAAVMIDGQAGAPVLCDKLSRAPKGFVMLPRVADVISAAGSVLDGLREGTLKHTQPGQEQLNDSAIGSCIRPIGKNGGWSFGSTEEIDSTPIEAAALALFAVTHTKRDPSRRQMFL